MIKQELYNDLIKGFILREYHDKYGPLVYSEQAAYDAYRNDVMLYARVRTVVNNISALIEKHVPESMG